AASRHRRDHLLALRTRGLEQRRLVGRLDRRAEIDEVDRLLMHLDLAHLAELFDEAAQAEFLTVDGGHDPPPRRGGGGERSEPEGAAASGHRRGIVVKSILTSSMLVMRGHSPSKTGVNALLTRASILLALILAKKMDCRVKPGNDGV